MDRYVKTIWMQKDPCRDREKNYGQCLEGFYQEVMLSNVHVQGCRWRYRSQIVLSVDYTRLG